MAGGWEGARWGHGSRSGQRAAWRRPRCCRPNSQCRALTLGHQPSSGRLRAAESLLALELAGALGDRRRPNWGRHAMLKAVGTAPRAAMPAPWLPSSRAAAPACHPRAADRSFGACAARAPAAESCWLGPPANAQGPAGVPSSPGGRNCAPCRRCIDTACAMSRRRPSGRAICPIVLAARARPAFSNRLRQTHSPQAPSSPRGSADMQATVAATGKASAVAVPTRSTR